MCVFCVTCVTTPSIYLIFLILFKAGFIHLFVYLFIHLFATQKEKYRKKRGGENLANLGRLQHCSLTCHNYLF